MYSNEVLVSFQIKDDALCSNTDILSLDWISLSFLNLRTISLILQYEILEKMVTFMRIRSASNTNRKTLWLHVHDSLNECRLYFCLFSEPLPMFILYVCHSLVFSTRHRSLFINNATRLDYVCFYNTSQLFLE